MPTLTCYCLSHHAFSNTACDAIYGGSKSVGDVLAFEECVQSDRSLQRIWAVLRVKLNVVPNSSAVGRPLEGPVRGEADIGICRNLGGDVVRIIADVHL